MPWQPILERSFLHRLDLKVQCLLDPSYYNFFRRYHVITDMGSIPSLKVILILFLDYQTDGKRLDQQGANMCHCTLKK